MEEKNLNCTDGTSCNKRKCCGLAGPFVVGLVVALTFGWVIFPQIIFSEKKQPIYFNHQIHIEDAGMSCADCHSFREDGSFAGIPSTESCASCHASPMGDDPEEAKFITEYVDTEREVRWLIHQKQPDNVFFSHAAHSIERCADGKCHLNDKKNEQWLCNSCHPSIEELDNKLAYRENILTGYSSSTMKMWQCEACHSLPVHSKFTRSNNACYVCHK